MGEEDTHSSLLWSRILGGDGKDSCGRRLGLSRVYFSFSICSLVNISHEIIPISFSKMYVQYKSQEPCSSTTKYV